MALRRPPLERQFSATAEDAGFVVAELSPPSVANSSSPSPSPQPRQGQHTVEIPDTILLEVNLRHGPPLHQSRVRGHWPPTVVWTFQWDKDTLESLVLNVRRRATQDAAKDFEWPLNRPLYLKPNRHASQANYLALDPGDYEAKLKRAWRAEARQQPDPSKTILKVFAYLTDSTNQPQKTSSFGVHGQIRQTSKGRIQASSKYIQDAINDGRLPPLGSMKTAHLAGQFAKRPPVSTNEPPVLPHPTTFRPSQHLDNQRAARRPGNTAERENRTNEYFSLTIKVSRKELREALGLPDLNLNEVVHFNARDRDVPENDIEDMDHLDDVSFFWRWERQIVGIDVLATKGRAS